MYRVTIGGQLLYAPSLIGYGYDLLTAKITDELNTVPHFDFSVPPSNPSRGLLTGGAEIVVTDDADEIYRGRVLNVSSNFRNILTVKTEGVLGYLNDAVVRSYSYTGSVSGLFTALINGYNAIVDAGKRFVVGTCNMTGITTVEQTGNPVYYAEIMGLVSQHGGYIWTRRVSAVGGDYNEINYTQAVGQQGTQVVQFGVNLLDLTKTVNVADIYTVIIPHGATPEGADAPIDITTAVIDEAVWGKDWIANDAAVQTYGVIERVVEFPEITDATALWTVANATVQTTALGAEGISLNALDMTRLGVNTDQMRVGNRYRLLSPPHSLNDVIITLTRAETDLLQVNRSAYTFGATESLITRQVAKKGG